MKSPSQLFAEECIEEVTAMGQSAQLGKLTADWFAAAQAGKYSYHFSWLGRPIVQYPQDILAMQEIIFRVRPDLIIETGIAHGGSLIFYSSLLELNALCGGPQDARVCGIDIDIRAHNRAEIESHPMFKRITMLEGSSIDHDIVQRVHAMAQGCRRILVALDSNHTHDHVFAELAAYAPLVSVGSYCVVFDTVIEYLPEDSFSDRPWGRGNNPLTAVKAFMEKHPEFEVDEMMDAKLMISVAPQGYLRKRESRDA